MAGQPQDDAPAPPPLPPAERFRPVSGRQRLRIVALTLITVMGLWYLLIWRPGSHPRRLPDTPCSAQQTSDCLGGMTQVLPGAAPASAAVRP